MATLFTSVCFGSQFACEPHLVSGWSQPETDLVWSNGRRSILRLKKPIGHADGCLTITLSPFRTATRPFQILRLAANGLPLASQFVENDDTRLRLFVSAETLALCETLNLTFDNDYAARPIDVSESTDDRLLAFALRSATIEPVPGCDAPATTLPANLLVTAPESGAQVARRRDEDFRAADRAVDGFRTNRNLPRLLEAHIRNIGSATDRRPTLVDAIKSDGSLRDPIDDARQLSEDVVARYLPRYRHLRFDTGDTDSIRTRVVFEETENTLLDPTLGEQGQAAFRTSRRPALELRTLEGGSAVIHPFFYLVCTRDERAVAADTNLKGLSRAILDAPRSSIDRPLVILQDFFDGGNISHFLFDHVTRLFHYCEASPEDAHRALFVLGGIPSDFHRIVLAAACDCLGLQMDQFLFPGEARVVRSPEVSWFSDQALFLHPAQWMHPSSREILDRLASHMALPRGDRRLYISRSDAGHRRIRNEAEIVEALRPYGYEAVRLADLPARDQMGLVASAGAVVAPHGMGLTHLVFNRGQPRLMELFHPTLLSSSYALLAKARALRYDAVFGTATGEANDYEVDLRSILSLAP